MKDARMLPVRPVPRFYNLQFHPFEKRDIEWIYATKEEDQDWDSWITWATWRRILEEAKGHPEL